MTLLGCIVEAELARLTDGLDSKGEGGKQKRIKSNSQTSGLDDQWSIHLLLINPSVYSESICQCLL